MDVIMEWYLKGMMMIIRKDDGLKQGVVVMRPVRRCTRPRFNHNVRRWA